MTVVSTFEEARELGQGRIGLVPTMGYLHEGHLSLVEASAAENDTTFVTVFVNPLQFNDAGDLDAYPTNLERDTELAMGSGADVIIAPSADYMYPEGADTKVTVGSVADAMEGAHRPGHFEGVATVVAKLFAGSQADRAYFGRKDAQQLAVVRAMTRDLSFPTDIRPIPIMREEDGLALSSRNVRLPDELRCAALGLFRGLMASADRYEAGDRDVTSVLSAIDEQLIASPRLDLDYAALADSTTAAVSTEFEGEQFLAVAGTVGGVRLIDNITIDSTTGTIDRGTMLSERSILYGGS